MMEPDDDWPCQFDGSPEVGSHAAANLFPSQVSEISKDIPVELGNEDDNGFTFPNGPFGMEEEEEDVTEIKIREFLDEKVKYAYSLGFFYINEHMKKGNFNPITLQWVDLGCVLYQRGQMRI